MSWLSGQSTCYTPGELSSTLRVHVVEGENWRSQAVLWPHMCSGKCVRTRMKKKHKFYFNMSLSRYQLEWKPAQMPLLTIPLSWDQKTAYCHGLMHAFWLYSSPHHKMVSEHSTLSGEGHWCPHSGSLLPSQEALLWRSLSEAGSLDWQVLLMKQ